ncbi:hypothetical protein J19TS2_54470 [Cohnella xylanilytica]|uniref:serine hydrolase domain-containing protein n=1 Tax=Cohnella xylanilytica TaxID=557555 RepID=UPI001B103E54|nr:serine hydrolase [Cohnella xylanilytica]GIO15892.1 hypothetical protein J19TS2_54470 [Cohnella xylanilytica]
MLHHDTSLPRAKPEEADVAPSGVLSFVRAANERKIGLHGFMLLRHGRVAAEGWWRPYGPDRPHIANSLTKSFVSIAAGIAADEGMLSVSDPVARFFPEYAIALRESGMEGLTVEHLLTMTTGHDRNLTTSKLKRAFLEDELIRSIGNREDGDFVRAFCETPAAARPGRCFFYNSGASHMLAAVIEKATGRLLEDYAVERLFRPLGIGSPSWERCPLGGTIGGWGLRLRLEDVAKLGQLLLGEGMWDGKRIVSAEWIRAATAPQTDSATNDLPPDRFPDWMEGYGYQFWQCRHNAFRGDGTMGQFCVVLPDRDAVVAIHGGTADMQGVLDLVWEHLLPSLDGVPADSGAASAELERELEGLSIAEPRPERSAAYAGSFRCLARNKEDEVTEVALQLGEASGSFVWRTEGRERRLSFGFDGWRGENVLAGELSYALGTWLSDRELVIDVCRVETPVRNRLTCRFDGSRLYLEYVHFDHVQVRREWVGEFV